ncbi:MAG: CapA family protein [Gemmatimonadetes bacterium]|nr:CapA family protein [Gemmatimonadota bacterium]
MMDRRSFLERAGQAAAALSAAHLVPVVPEVGAAAPARITLAAVGDCILTRQVSKIKDDRFLGLVELLRRSDCTWGNCEMTFFDARKGYPTPKGRDQNLVCEPWGADELAWMGFDMVGCANNHTKDYGNEGLLGNLENLRRVGIASAGTGPDLQEASRPGYGDTLGGRVAQVNCASTFPEWSLAAYATPHSNGRPGLNPLRVDWTYQIQPPHFEALKKIDEMIGQKTARRPPEKPSPPNELVFQGRKFVPGQTPDVLSAARPEDMKRITDAVAVARRNARIVIVTIHAHESYTDRGVPALFLQPFARASIDAGADAFFGTGPHLLRGVEIYQGKPIFYSLGNFFFQYATLKQIPAEVFAANDLDVNTLDPSLSYDKFFFPQESVYWESVVPHITFENGQVVEIQLHPVVLGQKEPRYERGTPILATREESQVILERLAKLSEPYGTSVDSRNGIGYVNLPRTSK